MTMRPRKQLRVVVGADGLVGGGLAKALQGKRIVSGPSRNGDTHITQAEGLLRQSDGVVNCGGFRVRPGCTYADYRRSHFFLMIRCPPRFTLFPYKTRTFLCVPMR